MGEDWEKRSGYANPNLLITMATVPNAGAVGIVSALISSKNKRQGDFVAGTVIVPRLRGMSARFSLVRGLERSSPSIVAPKILALALTVGISTPCVGTLSDCDAGAHVQALLSHSVREGSESGCGALRQGRAGYVQHHGLKRIESV